jgi:Na+-transporting NADH:ubiquinone oxidoreductase subunit F
LGPPRSRSIQELFYRDYFDALAKSRSNFQFNLALPAPQPEDRWSGQVGFIHEVARHRYLRDHPAPATAEYYLCGPPMMIKASTRMLAEIGLPSHQIAYDEF